MEQKYYLNCEIKGVDEEKGIFEGYASTFGNIDHTNDIIERGAFAESLKTREPKVLWQHKMDCPIGKVVKIYEDEKGLYVKVKLAINTTMGKDAYEFMKEDIINRLSIGFTAKESEYDQEKGNRIIKEAELFEFSLVTIPANDMAQINSVKSKPDNIRDFEKFLRSEGGFSAKEAKTIAARGIKGYQDIMRDANDGVPCDAELRDAEQALKNLLDNIKRRNENVTRDQTDR